MPPRWPRKPDRADPDFRRLDDRMNFAVHVAVFATLISGLWFFQIMSQRWEHLDTVSLIWAVALLSHGLYVFAIADYNRSSSQNN
jgi:hypothetical protein